MGFPCSDGDKKAKTLGFRQLECLRRFYRQTQLDQFSSLDYFAFGAGFQHVKGKNKISVSSTATCVLSLVATDSWRKADRSQTKQLLQHLLSKVRSAGLPRNNPFTIAWILEAVTALEDLADQLDSGDKQRIVEKETILKRVLAKGGVSMRPYPPSGYLTQLVVRTLRRRGQLTPQLEEAVRNWAWAELPRELALVQAKSKAQDAYALAYLLMLVTSVTPATKISPEQSSIQRAALRTFFDCQLEDGSWPLSRPLFHYPKFGNAYCYEYEMLTQLLQEPELQDLLLEYLPHLNRAAESVANSVYRVEGGIQAWTSGHHPNLGNPESWATASVYHFLYVLDRLLAEAVRRELFRYLEFPIVRSTTRLSSQSEFAADFLDSTVEVQGNQRSLKEFLWEAFVQPVAGQLKRVDKGSAFNKGTPTSAIFFGPPGTSKTEMSKKIADFLGWPHISIHCCPVKTRTESVG